MTDLFFRPERQEPSRNAVMWLDGYEVKVGLNRNISDSFYTYLKERAEVEPIKNYFKQGVLELLYPELEEAVEEIVVEKPVKTSKKTSKIISDEELDKELFESDS